jgi:hypothetical protein
MVIFAASRNRTAACAKTSRDDLYLIPVEALTAILMWDFIA